MQISEQIKKYEEYMTDVRRYLHQNPELSGQEEKTLAYIEGELTGFGIETLRVCPGGVLGIINKGKEGRTVLLRADVDALPVEEDACNQRGKKVCVSKVAGVMHACGHDMHTAMLLGAARVIQENREEFPGQVVVFFEQAEEIGGRLAEVVKVLEQGEIRPDVCYGAHVRWDIPSGKVALLDGAAMAGGFGFDVVLHGEGGHGSRPDIAHSPIDCFAAIHMRLNALRMTHVAPEQVLTYSLGIVQGGDAANVIPGSLRFAGTVRSFDVDGACEAFAQAMRAVIEGEAKLHGCRAEFLRYTRPVYETRNDPQAVALAKRAIVAHGGTDVLTQGSTWMASESLSVLLRLYPGVLAFVGIQNEALGSGANHHTPQFDVDDAAMQNGTCAAVAFAYEALRGEGITGFTRRIESMEDLTTRSI